jgi:hypothetical protein
MNKVKELEDRWFKYRMKKLLSPLIRFSIFSLVVVGSYYVYETKGNGLFSLPLSDKLTNVLGVSMEVNNSMVEKKSIIDKTVVIQEESSIEPIKAVEKIALVPIIPVIDMEKEERISDVKRHKPLSVANTVAAKKNNYLTAKELAVIRKTHKEDEIVPRKTKKMNFTSTSSNYIETMKHKFSKSNSPRDALLLAKTYYKNKKYVEAEKWSLSANKLDNSLEESWFLFAKSKVKLGKKKEALKILVSYYRKSHSVKAKRLIGQIKTGRI